MSAQTPTSVGRTRAVSRTRWSAIGAAVAITLGGGGLLTTSASVDSGNRSIFVPITPCRLMDTRPAPDNVGPRSTPIGAGESYIAQVTGTNGNCTIPATATAVSMNVTIITPTLASFLTIWPADQTRPLTANQNWIANQPPTPNAVTVALSSTGTTGQIGIYNLAGTVHIAADIVGYYDTHTHDDRYYTKSEVDQKLAAIPAGPQGPIGPAGPTGPTGAGANGSASRVVLDSNADRGQGTAIALGLDGLPVVAYVDDLGGILRFSKCSTPACTGTSINSAPSGNVNQVNTAIMVTVAIAADGFPVIALNNTTSGDLDVVKCADDACAGGRLLTPVDTAGSTGFTPNVAIAANGLPIISYYDATNGALRLAVCTNALCSTSTLLTLDGAGAPDDGAWASIAIGTDGFPVIAYAANVNSSPDLRVLKCASQTCETGSNTITTLAMTGAVGLHTSIAIGSDGLPIVSYYDDTNDDLRVEHCNDAACTTATRTVVDSTGNVGATASLAIGSDGFPVIAYYDATNGDLKVAKCVNVACTGTSTVTVVDGADADVGAFTSISIGADGFPIISYFDGTNDVPKVAKCSDPTCRPITAG